MFDSTELVTERRNFADERVSQRKERVLNTWRILAEALLGGTLVVLATYLNPLSAN